MKELWITIVLGMALITSGTAQAQQESKAPVQLPGPPYQSVGAGQGLAVQVFTSVKRQGRNVIVVPLLCGTITHDKFNPQLPASQQVSSSLVPGTYLSRVELIAGIPLSESGSRTCIGTTPANPFRMYQYSAVSNDEMIAVAFYSSKNVVTVIDESAYGQAPTQ